MDFLRKYDKEKYEFALFKLFAINIIITMKSRFKTIVLYLLFSQLFGLSCGKPVFSTSTVSFDVDGKSQRSTFVTAGIGNSENVFTGIGDLYSFHIAAFIGAPKFIEIILFSDKACEPGEYIYADSYLNSFKEMGVTYSSDMSHSFYDLDETYLQSRVTLESIDYRIGGRAKGTFSVRMVNEDTNDVIEITNGKFDVLIEKP